MSIDPEKEKELKDLIDKGKALSEEITNRSRDRMKDSQYITDLANETLEVTKYGLPPNIETEPISNAWRYVISQENEILRGFDFMPTATSGTAVAYSSTGLANPNEVIPYIPHNRREEVSLHVNRLSQVIDRKAKKDEVLNLLNILGLNEKVRSRKEPGELFNEAWEAFETPVTIDVSASTSLIPMRESIEMVIAILLRRRPRQEPANNPMKKIQSILNQVAYDRIPPSAIDDLANRWSSLKSELSASKQAYISRQQCRDTLRRATILLVELLQSVDKSKIKNNGLAED